MLVDSKRCKTKRIRNEIEKVNACVDRYINMLVKENINSKESAEFLSELVDISEEEFMENARTTAFKMSELRTVRKYLEHKTGIYSDSKDDLIDRIDHVESRVAEAGVKHDKNDVQPKDILPGEEYSLGLIYRKMTGYSEKDMGSIDEDIDSLLEKF